MWKSKGTATLSDLPILCVITCVDKVPPEEWDLYTNAPTEPMKHAIERKCQDVSRRLQKGAGVAHGQIEYCSALKRYRLLPVVTAVVKNARHGVRVLGLQPKDPWEMADPEARALIEQERQRRYGSKPPVPSAERFIEEVGKDLPVAEAKRLQAALRDDTAKPARVAVFGQAGAGKTTLVNNAFSATFKTSHTFPGTDKAQVKEFDVESGGKLQIIDLPGYGRSVREDKEYETVYRDAIPGCDLVLLVIQADKRDLADDIEMIPKLANWLRAPASV